MSEQPIAAAPEPVDLPSRIALLQQNGHGYLDPTSQVALAQSASSNNELLNIADGIKNAVTQSYDGLTRFFHDPVLQQQPTQSLALSRYVNSAIGPTPVADTDLTHMQQQLQSAGFGTDLPVSGRWDPSWNAAYNQAAQKHLNDQINGNKPGSVTVGHALSGFLHSFTPVGAVNALVGFAKSLPGDLRQMVEDNAGVTTGALDFLEQSVTHNPLDVGRNFNAARDQARNLMLRVNHGLLGHETQQQLIHDTTGMHTFARAINDIGTALLVSGVGDIAGAAEKGVSLAVKEGLFTSTEQAMRGPGLIARNVFGGLKAEDLAKVAGDGASSMDRRILLSKSFQNMPVLGRAAPLLGKLSDADGYWYRMRAGLDKPYNFGIVRAAGQITGSTGLAGLAVGGVSSAEQLVDPQGSNPIASNIDHTHVLDHIDDGIRNRLSVDAFGHHFGLGLNDLIWVLHAPEAGVGALADQAGDVVQSMNDRLTHGLSETGAIAQYEGAMKDTGMGQTWPEFVQAAGGQARANDEVWRKVKEAAASWGADKEIGAGQFAGDNQALLDAKRVAESRYLNDPALLEDTMGRMLNDGNFFRRYLTHQISLSGRTGKDAYNRGVGAYRDAADLLIQHVHPNAEHVLSAPLTAEQRANQVAKAADDEAFANFSVATGGTAPVATADPTVALPTGHIGMARFEPLRDSAGNIMRDEHGNVLEDVPRSTLTYQQATRDAKAFRARLDTLNADTLSSPEDQALNRVRFAHELRAYLLHNEGIDATKASVRDEDPAKLIDLIENQAGHKASEIHLTADAPAQMREAINRMKEIGFRPVTGTDIGHAFVNDIPANTHLLGAPISRSRKVLTAVGLNNRLFSGMDQATVTRAKIARLWQQRFDTGQITPPPLTNVNSLFAALQSDENLNKKLPWGSNVMFSVFRRAHEPQIQRIMADRSTPDEAFTYEQAKAVLAHDIAHSGGLRDITYPEFKQALMQPTEKFLPAHLRSDVEGLSTELPSTWFSERDARLLWKDMQEAYSDRPKDMVGAGSIEARLRYLPFWGRDVLTKGTGKGLLPDAIRPLSEPAPGNATMTMLNLPNKLAQVRDRYRFTLSPFFSLRRIFKTNVKMAAEGIQPTLNPVQTLVDSGRWNSAHDLLDEVMGADNPAYKYLDDSDRFLHGQDVIGLYNSRHYAAYIADQMKQAGSSNTEIQAGLRKIMSYGTRTQEGRTAAEQTLNVIFFPFSFEKTVIRNLGGYLLDRPAQAMVLSNALDQYRDFNNNHLNGNNPVAASWWEQHVPLLSEALRLNAFEHGISPGQLGGINAPLLNMFMPQSYSPTQGTKEHLAKFIPAINDAKRILKEGSQQSRIIATSLHNGVTIANDHFTGHQRGLLDFRPSNKTDDAQRQEAFDLRNKLVEQFKPVLDHNLSVSDDVNKYHWPSAGPGADKIPASVRGQAISKESIGILVQTAYPVYNPAAGAGYAIAKQIKANEYISRHLNTPNGPAYKDYLDKARTAIGHLNKDDYPAEQAKQVTTLFREKAAEFASKDPSFLRFYNDSLKYSFGPIERLS